MGDSGANGGLTRRRRATLAERRTVSLLAVDSLSAAACQSSAAAGSGQSKRRDRSLETASPKSEKQRGRNELGERLR